MKVLVTGAGGQLGHDLRIHCEATAAVSGATAQVVARRLAVSRGTSTGGAAT